MKFSKLPLDKSLQLHCALGPSVFEALLQVSEAGSVPRVRAERIGHPGGPSEWNLLVFGEGQVRKFPINDPDALAVVAYIYTQDFNDTLKADIDKWLENQTAAETHYPVNVLLFSSQCERGLS